MGGFASVRSLRVGFGFDEGPTSTMHSLADPRARDPMGGQGNIVAGSNPTWGANNFRVENKGLPFLQASNLRPWECSSNPSRVQLGIVSKLRTDRDQECDRVDDPQIGHGLGGVRTFKKVTVARHEVVGLTFGCQIEVRFVLWVASQSDAGSDFIHADGDSFDSSDELGDHVIRQLSELSPNLRSTDYVLDLSEDRRADVELQETLLSQGKAGTRWTRSSSSRLQEDHAVEHDARTVFRHPLFQAGTFAFGERFLTGRIE